MTGETLGYYFAPPDDGMPIGHPRLEFNLYDHPTEQHFDPEHAAVVVATAEGDARKVVLSHPWPGADTFRTCAGRLVLHDRKGHAVEAFSLGGRLEIASHDDHTACTLASPAPIFEVARSPGIDIEDVIALLVEDFEALLALRSAHWTGEAGELSRRLAASEPGLLYGVMLAAVDDRIHRIAPERRTEPYRLTSTVVHAEIRRLADTGRWPSPLPALDDVL
jgi:hypothetical protein